ncbi:MAG: UDP-4-amino-4-deoxy-L-arabinose--oxoglutarate aminotransferase [Ktedonobacterales bacterium]|jgi:dTDP-4-amino-4,6-dideoxygalactose transaminase|nr:MAG: UDP-4-amino-4-deoxy-L-arabinose--oxoglutarate aminotransferase [Ktedonobacterales bacterium]
MTTVSTTATTLAEIPLVDLKAQYAPLKDEMLAAIANVLDGMHLFLGPEQRDFEQEFAAFCGTSQCIGVSNGTDAIELALRALGIGAGDEVITQPNSFIATGEAISAVGAIPIFVDVNEATSTLDPTLLEAKITPRTKAIIPVHLYGRPADMPAILAIAEPRGIPVIEDASQAHGAEIDGQRVGSFGTLATFSFYFSKNLGAYGEAGAVTTNDPDLAARVRLYRDHGSQVRYHHEVVGRNARMDEIQAAILRIKLRHLPEWNVARRDRAAVLTAALAGTSLTLPVPGGEHVREVFYVYAVRHPERDRLKAFLGERGINTGIHFPIPIHLQQAYADLGYTPGSYPVTERLSNEILSLPMYAELTDEQIARIAAAVREFDAAGA